MTKAVMVKSSYNGVTTLRMHDAADPKFMSRYDDNSLVVVEVRKIRGEHGVYQLRKWWKLCAIIAANMPTFNADERGVSDMLLIACGEVDYRVKPQTGEVTPVPRSLSLENMEEDVFDRLWRRVVFYVTSEWLPIGSEKLNHEIEMFFAGPDERARRSSLGKADVEV